MKNRMIYFFTLFIAVLLLELPLEGGFWNKKGDDSKVTEDRGGKISNQENIVVVVKGADHLSTFVIALKAADLLEVLKGEGPFTIFAPNNEAFTALGTQLDELLKPENKEKLRTILLLHVVPEKLTSSDFKDKKVKTASGDQVLIKNEDGKMMVDEAEVIFPDIKASNGVIHIIDKVNTPN